MIAQLVGTLLPIAAWILFASLKSLVIIPLVLLIRRFSLRWLAPQGRYGLWYASIACLSIPFGAGLEISNKLPTATPAIAQVTPQVTMTRHDQPTIRIVSAPGSTMPTLSGKSAATLIWLAGVTALVIAVLYNTCRYRRIKSSATDVDAGTDALFKNCKQILHVRRRVQLLETSLIGSPAVVGYWQPTLLLPQKMSSRISSEQLRLVLLHELVHIRRHDVLANWLITLVQIAHWFNPLAWYALRVMRNDMEHACDASVLQMLSAGERVEYGKTLIALSDFAPGRALLVQNASVIESRSQLRERISMIARFRPHGAASTLLGFTLLALTASFAMTQAATPPLPPPAQQAANPAPASPAPQRASPAPAPTAPRTRPVQPPKPVEATPGKADKPSEPDTTQFRLTYAKADDVIKFIKSAPGTGLLSATGSIAIDADTNTLFVRDAASNISTIRQLISKLDTPVEQVELDMLVAWIDGDLLQELTATASSGSSWLPAAVASSKQSIITALEAAQKDKRAQIISSPHVVVANRSQALIEQGSGPPAGQEVSPKSYHLRLTVTPTRQPENRVELAVKAQFDSMSPSRVTANGNTVPSIDTREMKSQIVVSFGGTAILSASPGPGRQLVAFITPRLAPPAP